MSRRTLAFVLAISLAPAAVRAQSAEVQKYLNSAVALFENLEYEKALKQLERARSLSTGSEDDATIALYEGVVLADMGKEQKALAAFEMGLSLTPDAKLPLVVSPKVEKVFATARARVAKILAPRLEAQREAERLRAEAANAEAVNRKQAEEAQVQAELERLKVEDARRAADEARRREEERAAPRPIPPPVVVVERASSGPSLRVLAVIPLGVGVVSAGVATYFLLSAKSRADSLDHHTVLPADAITARDSGKSMANLGYAFTAVAAAGIATAGLMFMLGRPTPSAPSVAISASPDSVYAAVGWSFP